MDDDPNQPDPLPPAGTSTRPSTDASVDTATTSNRRANLLIGAVWAVALVAAVWIWSRDTMLQFRVLPTFYLMLAVGLLTLIWFAVAGPFARRVRWTVSATLFGAVVLFFVFFRIEQVSGDFFPTLTRRFGLKPDEQLAQKGEQVSTVEPRALEGMRNWPQFLGPERLGVVGDLKLSRDWTAPPKEIWRRRIGAGLGGFAIAGGRLVTMEQRGEKELITCYDAATGTMLWKQSESVRLDREPIGGIGPRTTPTIDGDRVYTVGATGLLNCLDLATGDRHWRHDIVAEAGASLNHWGMAGSPLIVDDVVVVNPGGEKDHSLVAYDKLSGEKKWASGGDRASYSSPMLAKLDGHRQILIFGHSGVWGHDATDGSVLWKIPWPGTKPKVAQPLVVGDNRLFLSTHYDVGCALYEVTRGPEGNWATRRLWKNLRLKSKFAHLVQRNGHVYGLNDGRLMCLDLTTGRPKWRGEWYGHGQMLLVDDLLLITTEDGEVVLVEASPRAFEEVARLKVFEDQSWNSPTLSGPYLFWRNSREAVCLRLPLAP
ncbi:MAG: PQQ-binding-like beta-propeller repeat protein [Phycisphaeraceae bacterium]|nr:PQQ-binding-like beta-propeller repeat protein [Phycisphaeraceae bacterium]